MVCAEKTLVSSETCAKDQERFSPETSYENQPFIDGNKRTAIVSALTFLDACGIDLNDKSNTLYDAMKKIGAKTLSKDGLEKLLANLGHREKPC